MKIVSVLRSGGDYDERHVRWLYSQLPGGYEKICLSDVAIKGVETLPLTTNFPGWWSKLELFNPEKIDDDIFYLDLDVVIVGDITDILENEKLTMLSDFYNPLKTHNSAIMRIPHQHKYLVWETFNRFPELFMHRYRDAVIRNSYRASCRKLIYGKNCCPVKSSVTKNTWSKRRKRHPPSVMAPSRPTPVLSAFTANPGHGIVAKSGFLPCNPSWPWPDTPMTHHSSEQGR
ncbi:hypothetical protein [Martelella alba]|uniref:Glycosyl transferase family 8 n=1 Tax=Martelella alba TaxID=2590451 RepID=A0ABY2SHS7_9HYPH|nr:hypothetical protein [Martelella alba]TKI04674.1 hypothetical protein FCN80_17070 [Martelella alba]